MRIWVDADACPNVIKEILYRAANRTRTPLILVANQLLSTPPSPFITRIQVSAGFDVADNKIVASMELGDIAITADIPLADAIVSKGCIAINPRGELYTPSNIKERLAMRNFSEGLRSSGMTTSGPAKFSAKDIRDFSNRLDQILNKKKP